MARKVLDAAASAAVFKSRYRSAAASTARSRALHEHCEFVKHLRAPGDERGPGRVHDRDVVFFIGIKRFRCQLRRA